MASRGRTKGLTRKQRAFLKAYAVTGTITHAAIASGVSRQSHYKWLEEMAYAQAFSEAENEAIDTLLQACRNRALGEGANKASDLLLIFLLKGKLPHIFRDRYEISGPKGGPIKHQTDVKSTAQIQERIKEWFKREENRTTSPAPFDVLGGSSNGVVDSENGRG